MTDGLGLGGVYGETLSRVESQGGAKSKLGMAALMWISHSERPLKVNELCHALGVKIGSADLDSDNVPSIGTLLFCCQGLVSVDKETSTVRLIHFSLQEYLRAHPEFFGRAHATMADTCLSYLDSHQVHALSAIPPSDFRSTPFLEYSSLYWGMHAKRDLSDYAKRLALKLFDSYGRHISTKILLSAAKQRPFHVNFAVISLFSSLHCASFFGIIDMVAGLVEVDGCDINQTDCTGSAPLVWAALNGHEGVVRVILSRDDINPDQCGMYGRTPLWCAAFYGYVGVVKMLLERDDIAPDTPDGNNRTPLLCAAENGHEEVVKLLLGREEVDPDKRGIYDRTPLWCAAFYRQEGVVKMLLERGDVNPDKSDINRRTPLWGAAENGNEGVVRILLGRDDVNPDEPDIYGQTPLWGAAVYGNDGVVKILLERGVVNPGKSNIYDQTLLSRATTAGHAGVIALLQPPGHDPTAASLPSPFSTTHN